VLVTGQELARLSSAGQYIPAPGGAQAPTEEFTLRNDKKGILKIDGLLNGGGKPSQELLLTNDLFRLVYAPRNLYYLGGRNGTLLPYPVYVPIQGTGPAETLVRDLINGPSGWLQVRRGPRSPPSRTWPAPSRCSPAPSGGRTALVNIDVPPHSVGLNERAHRVPGGGHADQLGLRRAAVPGRQDRDQRAAYGRRSTRDRRWARVSTRSTFRTRRPARRPTTCPRRVACALWRPARCAARRCSGLAAPARWR